MDESKLEYLCPFCKDYVLKSDFKVHEIYHRNDPMCHEYPNTLQELKERFQYLGLWEEK